MAIVTSGEKLTVNRNGKHRFAVDKLFIVKITAQLSVLIFQISKHNRCVYWDSNGMWIRIKEVSYGFKEHVSPVVPTHEQLLAVTAKVSAGSVFGRRRLCFVL